MENLATESFSYSWLEKAPPPPPHSQGLIEDDSASFRFEVSSSCVADDLVNADEIFSEGQIMAVYKASSVTDRPASVEKATSHYMIILRRWGRSSKKILLNCLACFLNTTCSRKSSRVDDLQTKVLQLRSFSNSDSLENSPPTTPCRYTGYVCCDADDNSIREAILYCKRSIEI